MENNYILKGMKKEHAVRDRLPSRYKYQWDMLGAYLCQDDLELFLVDTFARSNLEKAFLEKHKNIKLSDEEFITLKTENLAGRIEALYNNVMKLSRSPGEGDIRYQRMRKNDIYKLILESYGKDIGDIIPIQNTKV